MVRGLTSDSEDSDAPPPRPVAKKKPKRRYSAADPLATSESEDEMPTRPVARKKKKPAPAPAEAPVRREPQPAKRKPAPAPKPPPKRKKPAPPAADDEEKELQTKTATAAVALWCRVKDLEEKKKRLKRVFDKLPKALADAAKEALKRKETAEEADAKAAAAAADAAMAALRAADEPEAFDELAEPENPVAGDAADEPVATLRGPVSASVLAAMTAPPPAAVAEAPSAGTASVLPKNIVECVLIKRKAELLGALDIKSLSAVFQTSSTLAALADDASTWHRVYAARRAAPRQAPDAGLAMQTEEQDYAPLIPAPFGGGGGGGGAMMDDDDVQLMAAPAAAPVHAMIIDDDEAPAAPEPGLTTVDEALGGKSATATAKKALLRAEDVTEEALGDDPGDAHVLLSTRNAFAGIPSANACSINDEKTRSVLDKLLKPAGVRSCWLSPGGSEHADRVRPAPTIGQAFGADDEADDADEEGVLPPLIYQQDGCVTKKGSIAVVRIDSKSRERDNEVPPDLDLAIAIRDCSLELKDQREALGAIKDDLRQWEGLKLKLENGTVTVGKSKLPEYGVGLKVDVNLWENALTDDMRKAVIRAGFVLMKYAREEGTRLTTKTASAKSHDLDAARNNGGRAIMGATIKGNTVRGEACRYDVYES